MGKYKYKSRYREGTVASIVGMICNLLLSAAKIIAGIATGLVSVIADGVNNLSDCGSCLISLFSFRLAAKPADKEHPYGHQRAEYIASMCIAFLVLLLAVELFRESFEQFFTGYAYAEFFVYVVLGISVLVKIGMFFFYRAYASKTDSDVLRAAATDSLCDCLTTLVALAGAMFSNFRAPSLDGIAGIFVALFILWQGIKIMRDAGSKLLGQAPSPELVSGIKARILQENGVLGLHDLKVYPYGPHKIFATVHIETDAREPALFTHELLDRIERLVKDEFEVELTAHLDPVALDDSEAQELEQRVRAAVEGMVDGMNIHDFRLVRGAKAKAVFEVGIPFSCKQKEEDIQNDIARAVRVLGDYEPIVTIERE